MGRVAFWLSWPALFAYLPFTTRTRVLVVADQEVLVTKGWLGSGKWVLPGGGLHRRELPLAGVLRELAEETGMNLDVNQVKDQGMTVARDSRLVFRCHRFAAELPSKVPVKGRRFELIDAAWVPLKELTPQTAAWSTLDLLAKWQAGK